MINTTIWIVIISILLVIIEMLRRKMLREKYAFMWLMVGFGIIIGALFPNQINQLSRALEFKTLANFVLLCFVVANLFIIMQLSLSLGKVENHVQTLAEEIALLKNKVSDSGEK